jgi:hypothetical protein
MDEIYRDSTDKAAVLGIAGATVTSVEFKRDGDIVSTAVGSTVPIPYKITQMDGPFLVVWNYTIGADTYTRTDEHVVVTPLFNKAELVADDPDFSVLDDDQVVRLEGNVRRIIEAYTGQTFGYRVGKVVVWGSGDSILNSPERIIELSTGWAGYRTASGGFTIERIGTGGSNLNIKVPEQEEAAYYGYNFNTTTFGKNRGYVLSGEFGWRSVPTDVKQAALLLAELFSCDESMWRDRYIKSIRAADWRFDFIDGGSDGTGSVMADQLLAKYVVNRMVII